MEPNICENMCCDKQTCPKAESDESYMSGFSKIAGTLTGKEIELYNIILSSNGEEIQEKTRNKNFKTTTVDLTVGDGHYLFDGLSNNNERKWKLIYIGNDERLKELNSLNTNAEQYKRPTTNSARVLVIPPFGSALVQLDEIIDTYSIAERSHLLVVGRFDLKLSKVHQGLISQQATQIEPCYIGKLFCFLHNLSSKPIELEHASPLATIEFSYVSCFCNENKRNELIKILIEENKKRYCSIYCNDGKGISDIRYFYHENRLPEDCGLAGLVNKLNNMQIDITYKQDENFKQISNSLKENLITIDSHKDNMVETARLKFDAFIASEETIQKLSENVNKRIQMKLQVISGIITLLVIIITAIIGYYNNQQEINRLEQRLISIENNSTQNRKDVNNIIDTTSNNSEGY